MMLSIVTFGVHFEPRVYKNVIYSQLIRYISLVDFILLQNPFQIATQRQTEQYRTLISQIYNQLDCILY